MQNKQSERGASFEVALNVEQLSLLILNNMFIHVYTVGYDQLGEVPKEKRSSEQQVCDVRGQSRHGQVSSRSLNDGSNSQNHWCTQ